MATQFNKVDISIAADEVVFSARELTVLNEIATVVSSAVDISDVYSSFSALVADILDWDGIIVNTSTDDGKTFEINVREGGDVPGKPPGTRFEIAGTLYGETIRTRKSQYFTADEGQTTELGLKIPGLCNSLLAGFRSFMATPLQSQGEIVGAIHIQAFKPHAFTDHDRMLLERIAIFVGPTIERFSTHEKAKKESDRTRSMLAIGRMLLSARDLDDVLGHFIDELRTVIEVDRLTIAVVEPSGEAVVDRYLFGVTVPGYEVNNVIPMDALEPNGLDVNSHGYILAEGALRESDPVLAPGLHANFKAGLNSAMFAGLHSEGSLVGTINVKSLNEGAYTTSDLAYFEQVADHLAASIARTISHESEIQMSRDAQERIKVQQEARRIVEVTQAKERLLTSASHELRTPLTGILAFVDLLSRNRTGNLEDKQLRYLSIVRRNAEDLSLKVNSLIDHAARDAGRLRITLEQIDLASMLQMVITDTAPKLAELDQTASIELDGVQEIIGDRRQLAVAIGHLLDNAMRYTPEGSMIRIVGERVGDSVLLSVIDEGSGILKEHVAGIFDPFERGELTGIAASPGAGLGLTYVRAVAVGHGGEALYESTPEGGARFTISIPARTDIHPFV
ncbi:MAG: ATP-binding protein [Dehalococcoidia bacterium]